MAGRTVSTRRQSRRKYQPDDVIARIVDAAVSLTRDRGPHEVTTAHVAKALHMRESAVLDLVGGVDQIRDWVVTRALRDLTDCLSQAMHGLTGRDALDAFIRTQRLYAQAHPQMYEAALRPMTTLSPEALDAMETYQALETGILETYGVPASQAVGLGWCLRAIMCGATGLEAADRLTRPHEIDQNFEQLMMLCEAAAKSSADATRTRQSQHAWMAERLSAPARANTESATAPDPG